jgi:hypothetical protein
MSVEAAAVQVGVPLLVYAVILLLLDYGFYFQSTIFTTLDQSGRGKDDKFRDPPYHPLCHWVLQLIAALGLVVFVVAFGLHVRFDFGPIFALLVGAFFGARYILMRRGIS